MQKQVRNSCVIPSQQTTPMTARTQTAVHTQARPTEDQGHPGQWGQTTTGQRCPVAPHPPNGGSRHPGLDLGDWHDWQCVHPHVPTPGRCQAGPEMPASVSASCVRFIRSTGRHKKRWRNRTEGGARGAPANTRVPPQRAQGRRLARGSSGARLSGCSAPQGLPSPLSHHGQHFHPTPPAGGNLIRGGQCPLGSLNPHLQARGWRGARGWGPARRCQVPWEANMAPAVSWKSRSCCRKRMACVGKWVQGGQGQDPEVRLAPTMHPLDHSGASAGSAQ